MLGDETILTGSSSRSDGKTTSSHQLMGRPLLSPAQMVRIQRDTWIVEKAGCAPMKTHLEGYWKYLTLAEKEAVKEQESDYQEVHLLSVESMSRALNNGRTPGDSTGNKSKFRKRKIAPELYPGKFDP